MNPSLRSVTATGPDRGRARCVLAVLLVALVWACGPPRERFAHTHESPEALATAYLEGLEAGDRTRLEKLIVSAQEYQLEVFPEMPVYGNIPPDFAWSQLEGKNRYGIGLNLDRFGGRAWDLVEITFDGSTTYQTFRILREPVLQLRDRATGERSEQVLFGSILEHAGRFKLLSASVDR